MKHLMSATAASVLLTAAPLAHATLIDLTGPVVADRTGTDNGTVYTWFNGGSGTGVFPAFVQVNPGGSPDATFEQGYNTTVNNVFDNGSSDTFNHELQFGNVGVTTICDAQNHCTDYVGFTLDVNQTSDNPKITLQDIQVFVSTSANQSVESFTGSGLVNFADSQLVYRLDSNTDILLDYSLNNGSGTADMTMLIPFNTYFAPAFAALFSAPGSNTAAAENGAYVYLYSSFGSPPAGNFAANDGFEEWAHFNGNPVGEPGCVPSAENNFCQPESIPEPGSVSLLGLALLGLGFVGLIRGRRPTTARFA
jgi:hypothetical protein